MAIEHKDIPNDNLHEPKGVNSALVDTVYVADGLGSGTWETPPNHVPVPTGKVMGTPLMAEGDNTADFDGLVWKDLLGPALPLNSGVGAPTLVDFRGTNQVQAYAYAAGDDSNAFYHIPHDYAPGTDLFLHLHWSHNDTAISGSFVVTCYISYAKGHNQTTFFAPITTTISETGITLGSYPRWGHFLKEIQISAASPSGSQFASNTIEPDGIIMVHYDVATIPTSSGGANKPFILHLDLHYQASLVGTMNKVPNFYI